MREDEEISALLEREMKKRKIKLIKEATVENLDVLGGGVHSLISTGEEIISDTTLVATGRAYNSEGIGLEKVGIETGSRGEILVDSRMATNVDGVYAIGDVTGGMLLANVASSEAGVAALNMMGGNAGMDYTVVPRAIFTTPEIASVGVREYEAKKADLDYATGHFQYRALGKAHAIGEISGIFKVVADSKTDRLLGVHIMGPHATDIIHEAALAIRLGLTVSEAAKTIHAHPTLSEGFLEAAEDAHNRAVHIPRKKAVVMA
jgi:dihydrolipoamide dehydrogenase